MDNHQESVVLINSGDGLLADLISPYVDDGYVIYSMDRLGRTYEARRHIPTVTPDGERIAA